MIDGADKSMYLMDSSINMGRDNNIEEGSENFDLCGVGSGNSDGDEEEEHALTIAMITKSTYCIHAHFHRRESTPKDITMSVTVFLTSLLSL